MAETSSERLERLLTALEQLCAQESFLIQSDELAEAAKVQQRLGVLAVEIPTLVEGLRKEKKLGQQLAARLRMVIATQEKTTALRSAKSKELRAALDETGAVSSRASRLRPVYGRSPYGSQGPKPSALDASG